MRDDSCFLSLCFIQFAQSKSSRRRWNPLLLKNKTHTHTHTQKRRTRYPAALLFRWHHFCLKCKSGGSSVSADICFDRWTHHAPLKAKRVKAGGRVDHLPAKQRAKTQATSVVLMTARLWCCLFCFLFFFSSNNATTTVAHLLTRNAAVLFFGLFFSPKHIFFDNITSPLHFECGSPGSQDGVWKQCCSTQIHWVS